MNKQLLKDNKQSLVEKNFNHIKITVARPEKILTELKKGQLLTEEEYIKAQ